MDSKEAIETLHQITGILTMLGLVAKGNEVKGMDKCPIDFLELSYKMAQASELAIDAIKTMDKELKIEKDEGGKNE